MKDNTSAIQKIVDWINNSPETVSSEIAASQDVRYTPTYLSKLFRKTTGITYREYSTIIKNRYAAVMLRDTEMPIFEIADKLGYSDAAAFSHAFTNACGYSPTEYRNNPDSISLPFFKIVPDKNKGVITMKKIDPANVVGDAFLKLLDLQPASIIMYCLLASFAASPTGMLRNYNPKGNVLPCIEIDASVAEMLPLSLEEVFQGIVELADVDLLTIVNMENDSFYVVINEIPEKLVSNGTLEGFVDFVNSQKGK